MFTFGNKKWYNVFNQLEIQYLIISRIGKGKKFMTSIKHKPKVKDVLGKDEILHILKIQKNR